VFFGVNETNLEAWRWVRAASEPFWYIDNSYFDHTRKTHLRITKGGIQCHWNQFSDGKRWKAIELPMLPWNRKGGPVVVCPQSDNYMRNVARYKGNWLGDTLRIISEPDSWSNRKAPVIKIRPWTRDKKSLSATLQDDLVDAMWLYTHSSAAAIGATLYGVMTSVHPMSALHGLEFTDEARDLAMSVLADNQWTVDEIRTGVAWEKVQ
jgi:hypothetical protein